MIFDGGKICLINGRFQTIDLIRGLRSGVRLYRFPHQTAKRGIELILRGVPGGKRVIEILLQCVGQLKEAWTFQQIIHDLRICFSGIEVSCRLRRQAQFADFIVLSVRHSRYAQKKVRGHVKGFCDADDIFVTQLVRLAADEAAQ